jgi:DNA-binding NarL/FixJ family response regulator
MTTITVVIADDQQMVRRGFRVILESEPDIAVVGEAGDGQRAVDLVRKHRPTVALPDIRMPVMDGLVAARKVIDQHPDTRVRHRCLERAGLKARCATRPAPTALGESCCRAST